MLNKISALAVAGLLGTATLVGGLTVTAAPAEAGYGHKHFKHHKHFRHGYYAPKRYSYSYYAPRYTYRHCKVWSYGYHHKKCVVWW